MTTMDQNKIHTQYLIVDPKQPEPEKIAAAGAVIRQGGLVGFPTETVYGLGANAWDKEAVARIFQAKGRPGDNPLIVHVADPATVRELAADLPPLGEELISRFWPGPLTLILPRQARVPDEVTAGLDTVAVRMPDHLVALALIKAAGVPIAAPSANLSGRPSPTEAGHVLADMNGRVEVILDGGQTGVGVESTVLDLTASVPSILRPGGVTAEALAEIIGRVAVDPNAEGMDAAEISATPRSPGMKYAHYAPQAPVILVEGEESRVVDYILAMKRHYQQSGQKVAILACRETADVYLDNQPPAWLEVLGKRDDLSTVASRLYQALRACDTAKADVILAEGFSDREIGAAVMNRLRRAAGDIVRV